MMKSFETSKLVKNEDLNHHNTLFAGRLAEWFAESAYIGASQLYGNYDGQGHLVAFEVHSLKYLAPSYCGDIIRFISTGVRTGKTNVTIHCKALRNNTDIQAAEGFITFVCLDSNNKMIPHNIVLGEPETEEEKKICAKFSKISRK